MAENRPGSPKFGMIADDLTGACDTGVQFARCGFNTVVLLDPHYQLPVDAELVVISTESRTLSPQKASLQVKQTCEHFKRENIRLVYKKIDSTLRGPIGAEIKTVQTVCSSSFAVVTPAFPAMGRTLIDGWMQVEGNSEFTPLHFPTLLGDQGLTEVVPLSLDIVRAGANALTYVFSQQISSGTVVAVCDAVTDQDLSIIVQAARCSHPETLLIGSAGLGIQAAASMAKEHQKSLSHVGAFEIGRYGPLIYFIGSKSGVTRSQVEYLTAQNCAVAVSLNDKSVQNMRDVMDSGRSAIIPILWEGPSEARHLHTLLNSFDWQDIGGVVCSGGDTAAHVCRMLGAASLHLLGEILPGLPWGRLIGGAGDGVLIATKAGAFGEVTALHRIEKFFMSAN